MSDAIDDATKKIKKPSKTITPRQRQNKTMLRESQVRKH
jgi:hypothetical protein